MTGFALPSDTGEIRALWDSCFPEEPEFSDLFFAKMFKSDTCLVLREDGIIKAMAQMLPYELKDVGKVTYIYGAATHPDFRRQGLMRRLLEASFELDKKRGFAASILIPANEALYGFYARLGYKTRFYIREGKPRMSGADLTGYALSCLGGGYSLYGRPLPQRAWHGVYSAQPQLLGGADKYVP